MISQIKKKKVLKYCFHTKAMSIFKWMKILVYVLSFFLYLP